MNAVVGALTFEDVRYALHLESNGGCTILSAGGSYVSSFKL
jgi:hypothetical protein